MRSLFKSMSVAAAISTISLGAIAQSSPDASQAEALGTIIEVASVICTSVPVSGNSAILELDGDAKAELEGLLKYLAELGIEGAAKFQNQNYSGVLQNELAAQIQKTNECRLSVLTLLSSTLLGANIPNNIADDRVSSVSLSEQSELLGVDQGLVYQDDLLSAAVMSAAVDEMDNQWLNFAILIRNDSNQKLAVSYPKMVPAGEVAFDDLGKGYRFDGVSGLRITQCNLRGSCPKKELRWTTLTPGSKYTVVFRARGTRTDKLPSSVSVSVNLLVLGDDSVVETRAIGFPNVLLKK